MFQTGRDEDNIFAFQVEELHRIINYHIDQGEIYDDRLDGIITNFEDELKAVANGAFTFNALPNSGAEINYVITQGEAFVAYNHQDKNFTPIQEGIVIIQAYSESTNSHKEATKEITLTITSDGTVGVEDFANVLDNLSIYPNPTKGLVYLTLEKYNVFDELSVYDATGKLILQNNQYNSEQPLDLNFLSNGVYSILVKMLDGTYSKKIILVH